MAAVRQRYQLRSIYMAVSHTRVVYAFSERQESIVMKYICWACAHEFCMTTASTHNRTFTLTRTHMLAYTDPLTYTLTLTLTGVRSRRISLSSSLVFTVRASHAHPGPCAQRADLTLLLAHVLPRWRPRKRRTAERLCLVNPSNARGCLAGTRPPRASQAYSAPLLVSTHA